MAETFNEQEFEKKLVNLKDTQDSIGALSSWCLSKKEHHKKVVSCWLRCLKRVKIDQRLSLFYLANDVIQYSKRKHYDFVESWGTALQKATPLVRDDKVKNKILRIFKIWEERLVYDEAFIADLCGLLTTTVKKKAEVVETSTDPNDFQPTLLVRKIKEIRALGENSTTKYKRIKDNKLPLTDAESMRLSLKDRRHGSDVAAEVDIGVKKMEAYVRALETEVTGREKLIELLRQATLYYETQRGEAKIVANAYRSFGGRLKTHQKAVEDLMTTLLSPLPSPDINAPSPSPDSDLQVPSPPAAPPVEPEQFVPSHTIEENNLNFTSSLVNSSFIGSGQFLELSKEVFTLDATVPIEEEAENAQPIEVIGNRDGGSSFDVAEFFKNLIPTKEPPPQSLPPPPMPPLFADWSTSVPWDQPPPETPQSPPIYENQAPMVPPIEYDDTLPVPPVPDIDHRTLLAHPPEMPVVDMDHRQPPPSLIGLDMDHRVPPPAMGMHNMEVPPPVISERGTIIPPNPVNINVLGPPPPPPPLPIKGLIDVDQRNLICLTGSPGIPNNSNLFTTPDLPYQKDNSNHHHNRVAWNNRPADGRDIKDNVESIDMDVSEDDDESHGHARPVDEEPFLPFTNPNNHPFQMNEPVISHGNSRSRGRGRNSYSGPRMMDEGNGPYVSDEPPHNMLEPPYMGNDVPSHQQEPFRGGNLQHHDPRQNNDNFPHHQDRHMMGPPFDNHEESMHEPVFRGNDQHQDSLHDRLNAMQNAGAKLVAPLDESGENGYYEQHSNFDPPRGPPPRWRSPHGRGQRPPRSHFPYRSPQFRGHPRQFRPRGRW